MIKPHALQEFRRQVAAGVKRPVLPEGAFDARPSRIRRRLAQDAALTPEKITSEKPAVADLSSSVRKALDAMSRPTRDALRNYLSRDTDPDEPATLPTPALDEEEVDRVCGLLEQAGVPEEAISKVREMLAGEEGDGDLLLQHKGDRNRPFTTKKAYDAPVPGGPASQYSLSADEPPVFPGAPRTGGGNIPLSASAETNRKAALDAAKRTKVLDAAGSLHFAKDQPPPRKPTTMAFDSANSLRNFHRRFPDAKRITILG
jgi:hypothetical protein